MACDICCFFCCTAGCSPAAVAAALAFAPPLPSYNIAILSKDGDEKEEWGHKRDGKLNGFEYPRYVRRLDRHGSRSRVSARVHPPSSPPETALPLPPGMSTGAAKTINPIVEAGASTANSRPSSNRSSVAEETGASTPPMSAPRGTDQEDLMLEGLIDVGESHELSTAVWRLYPGVQRVLLPRNAVAVTLAPRGKTLATSPHILDKDSAPAPIDPSGIPVFSFIYPGATFTMLFSHGNAADAGLMKDTLADMSLNLKINIVAYEYSGYGPTKGIVMPSEESTCADIEAVYVHMMSLPFVTSPRSVILYGQSLGSGPTCYLAAKRIIPGNSGMSIAAGASKGVPVAAAVVLHSPIASGLRVLTDNRCLACFDIFPNIDRIHDIAKNISTVYIMHGQRDTEVPASHGARLYDALPAAVARNAAAWFPTGAGHNNIMELYREEYYTRLRGVIKKLQPRPSMFDSAATSIRTVVAEASDAIIPHSRLSAAAAKVWSSPSEISRSRTSSVELTVAQQRGSTRPHSAGEAASTGAAKC